MNAKPHVRKKPRSRSRKLTDPVDRIGAQDALDRNGPFGPHRTKIQLAHALGDRRNFRIRSAGLAHVPVTASRRRNIWAILKEASLLTTLLLLGFILGSIIIYTAIWYVEPSMYGDVKVTVEDTEIGQPLRVHADVEIKRLCPYMIENAIWQEQNGETVKLFGGFYRRETPQQLGRSRYVVPIPAEGAKPGPAVYIVRQGIMCNPLRMIFPLWTEWLVLPFYFRHHIQGYRREGNNANDVVRVVGSNKTNYRVSAYRCGNLSGYLSCSRILFREAYRDSTGR
jgi:hypothetical protein